MISVSPIIGTLLTGLLLLGSTTCNLVAHDGEDDKYKSKNGKLQRVLIFSKTAWYRHPALPELNGFLVRLGAKHNIQ
ncbi:uncharacterized protein METZ01_LOCUS277086, partial [marine metagenome]